MSKLEEKCTISELNDYAMGKAQLDDGSKVLIPNTLPGETVLVEKIDDSKSITKLKKVITPSEHRIEAQCKVYGECGACDLQHMDYTAQLEFKKQVLLRKLKQVKIAEPSHLEIIPADKVWNYRSRVQFKGHGRKFGFHAKQSHDVVGIQTCPIASQAINELIPELKKQGKKKLRPYQVEVDSFQEKVTQSWNKELDERFFHQVNEAMNQKLKDWMQKNISANLGILDLFGGQGNLSLGLAGQHESIDCVDTSILAANADTLPENFFFHPSRVDHWLDNAVQEANHQTKIVFLDPPRAGLGIKAEKIIEHLNKMKTHEIFLIGCLAQAWSQDLEQFLKSGWKIKKMALFDFFPQTRHFESVALLVPLR